MWSIQGNDVFNLARTGEGRTFTSLMDAIIRAECRALGIADAYVNTNIRTNLSDGGVDTQIDQAALIPDQSARFNCPTIWQFKAKDFQTVKREVADEVKKDYTTKLINQGYAYRLCICDEAASRDKTECQTELTRLVKAINPNAPDAQVLLAGDIADWVSNLPGIVLQYFWRGLDAKALHFEAWGENENGQTASYVPVTVWEDAQANLKNHIDFAQHVHDPVFPIQGEAGIGKTRFVYESLKAEQGIANLVLYTDDDRHAQEIAVAIANHSTLKVVLVADECSLSARNHLSRLLKGHTKRARVITIGASDEALSNYAQERLLKAIPQDTVVAILATNFPNVPDDRRRAYVELSSGFIGPAADMCVFDDQIAASGHVGPVLAKLDQYVTTRFQNNDELRVLQALALVDRIGFRDDVLSELDQLCTVLGLDRSRSEQIARKIHKVPGFIAQAGRYFLVKPDIIAQIAFIGAWEYWAVNDPEKFLADMPTNLRERMYRRIISCGPENVRSLVGDNFRNWASTVTPGDLAVLNSARQLEMLVDIEPNRYFPVVRRLIEEATYDELYAIKGNSSRRLFVWLAERMASFEQYFEDAEYILRRLAVAESEGVGNNATAVWKHLFRIYLSGTAVSYQTRIGLLRSIIFGNISEEANLAVSALNEGLSTDAFRTLGPVVVAGLIPPPEWRPSSDQEYNDCYGLTLILLSDAVQNGSESVSADARNIATATLRLLIELGFLDNIVEMLKPDELSDTSLVAVISELNTLARLDLSRLSGNHQLPGEYIQRVIEWREKMRPINLHRRLVVSVGVEQWHYQFETDEPDWNRALAGLARELLDAPAVMESELSWLNSAEARSAMTFGKEVGLLDTDARVFDRIISEAVAWKSTAFARGYVDGLIRCNDSHVAKLNDTIDGLEMSDPQLAFELSLVDESKTNALDRAFRMVDSGFLSAGYLQSFWRPIGDGLLTLSELTEIIERMATAIKGGDNFVVNIAVRQVSFSLHEVKPNYTAFLKAPSAIELLWQLLEITSEKVTERHWWTDILGVLVPFSPERAAQVAVSVVISNNSQLSFSIGPILSELARNYPKAILEALSPLVHRQDMRWRLALSNLRPIVWALPDDPLLEWMSSNGENAVLLVAGHLPPPFLADDATPVVPPITEFILSKYENNDEVFQQFISGSRMDWSFSDVFAKHKRKAEVAMHFLNNPLKRVREWASNEEQESKRETEFWRRQEQEGRFN